MGYRKKTLQRMLPTERQVAKLIVELERSTKALKKMLPVLHAYEALARTADKTPNVPRPADWKDQDALRKVGEDFPF